MPEDPPETGTSAGRSKLANVAAHKISSLLAAAFLEQEQRTPDESRIYGAKLREEVPAEAQAMWPPKSQARPNPLGLLESQAADRVPELLPIRYERMAQDPFAFYRGCALPMAGDLATTPMTPLRVQASGDAHIANFSIFATPERQRVFDLNDFDETARGPWEWDLKRLAASVDVCARVLGLSREKTDKAVHACVNTYHQAMAQFAEMGNLEV